MLSSVLKEKIDPSDLQRIADRHQRVPAISPFWKCSRCEVVWPCDAVVALSFVYERHEVVKKLQQRLDLQRRGIAQQLENRDRGQKRRKALTRKLYLRVHELEQTILRFLNGETEPAALRMLVANTRRRDDQDAT